MGSYGILGLPLACNSDSIGSNTHTYASMNFTSVLNGRVDVNYVHAYVHRKYTKLASPSMINLHTN